MKASVIFFSCLLAMGCTINNETGDGEGGAAGQSNTGGASSGGSSGGGSGGATGGGCVALCAHTGTATSAEVDCVAAQAYLAGYDWPGDPVCTNINVSADCELCTSNLKMPDAVCANVENSCFGGGGSGGSAGSGSGGSAGSGSGGSAGSGAGGSAGSGTGGSAGSGTGGTSGGVTTCSEMCQHAPTATTQQEQCVELNSYLMGYDWTAEPVCAASDTVPGCNACTAKLGMKDADCAALYAKCF